VVNNGTFVTLRIGSMSASILFTGHSSVDKIPETTEKAMGISRTTIKCHELPDKMSLDL